jgi:hypothetical protein
MKNVLISVYSDAGVSTMNAWEFDGKEYLARDVFVTRSTDGGVTWSQPVCVSVDPTTGQTFASSSTADADPDGILGPVVSQAYPGDCEKPQVFGNTQTGRNAVITFHCAYDMDGQGLNQSVVEYPEFGGISRPYHTTYVIKTSDGGLTWGDPQQLGDASRDAKQVAVRGSGPGIALAWQEDPHGLQPGEGDGPGDGGSGAKASQGTDAWYTALKTAGLREHELARPDAHHEQRHQDRPGRFRKRSRALHPPAGRHHRPDRRGRLRRGQGPREIRRRQVHPLSHLSRPSTTRL